MSSPLLIFSFSQPGLRSAHTTCVDPGPWPASQETSISDQLVENVRAFVEAVSRAKPTGAKGTYMKRVALSSTMGPGVTVDVVSATGNA